MKITDILFLLISLLGNLCTLSEKESSSVLRKPYLSLSRTFSLPLVMRIFSSVLLCTSLHYLCCSLCSFLVLNLFVLYICSCNDVCYLWGKQRRRWLLIHDLQWREYFWIWISLKTKSLGLVHSPKKSCNILLYYLPFNSPQRMLLGVPWNSWIWMLIFIFYGDI